ncbi:MAG: hypothetical protein ABJC74_07540 [Gemmatimonadota bacterium]
MNEDQKFGIVMSLIFGVMLPVILGFGIPLMKAWSRRLERGSQPDHDTAAELDELRHRVAELEERADFSERLLAQADQQERLKS